MPIDEEKIKKAKANLEEYFRQAKETDKRVNKSLKRARRLLARLRRQLDL